MKAKVLNPKNFKQTHQNLETPTGHFIMEMMLTVCDYTAATRQINPVGRDLIIT